MITMFLIPFVTVMGTVMWPVNNPELTVRDDVAFTPPTWTPVVPLIVSLVAQPVPLTVITVPPGPVLGAKVAVAVTVKALLKGWAPLVAPVITMVLAPPAGVRLAGTMMLPDSAPLLLTDSVCVADVPPTVTGVIISLAVQPVPLTVIKVPTGPAAGLKVSDGVTVKALLNVWAPLVAPVITMPLSPGVRPAGMVMLPDSAPPLLIVKVRAADVPPTVTAVIVSLATQPVPLTVTTVFTGPLAEERVAVADVTVKALLNGWAPLVAPVIAMALRPVVTVGTMMVPDSTPEVLTVRNCPAAVPPTVTGVISSPAVQPVPFTVIVVPTGPVAGVKVAPGLITKSAEGPVSTGTPPDR